MRILYDGQIYNTQKKGGISRYFNNLINCLPKDYTPLLTTYETDDVIYPEHPNLQKISYKRFRPARISQWFQKQYFQTSAALGQPKLIHPTYYTTIAYSDLSACKYPIVLTVWDMIHELFAPKIDPNGQQAAEKRRAITAAQTILCISENTKKDLLEHYAIPEERVIVTYLASEIDMRHTHGPEPVPSRPYYLYVGGRYRSYKNFDTLLNAFAKVTSLHPEIILCLVGPPLDQTEHQTINDLGLTQNIEYYGYADDQHLAKLYRCSLALVYPSLYEGFGIPPLEAMACGTPVIASNRSSLPEVIGDAGILFDPTSVPDLADILLHLSETPSKREELIFLGQQRAKLFSWEKTTAQTLAVYRSVANLLD
ncbi:glycosyltransferase family 4 protein [Anthocerotibacter panamensis]|uniref:glycosyltransferase family 4 protein n=1 Tax=Anthocerotibacter panamensis TaxID=2857077 RepID=UPI001C4031DF|nr:glycosyltransferase family 1 protein [Anthocerotibacter panamensis]